MKIAVCIKQVPDTAEVRIDPETHTLVREGVESILNPLDAFAVEEAVRMREFAGGEVIAFTMGPAQSEEALREAMALGADRAVLLTGKEFAGADTWATSYALACAIRAESKVKVIFCGKQAIDGDTAQVGPGIAAHLRISQLTFVRWIREMTDTHVIAESISDTGFDVIKAELPVVITVVKEINEPRLPSLESWMKARSTEVRICSPEDIGADPASLGLNGSPTRVIRIDTPHRTKDTRMFAKDAGAGTREILRVLEDLGLWSE